MRLNYQVKGVRELNKLLDKAGKGLEDYKEPLDHSGIHMHKSINQNFSAQGRPSKWAGHHWLTKQLRGGGQVLSDTGALRASVTSKGAGSKYQLSKDKLVIGSNLKASGSSRLLAEIHQNGLPAGVNKVFGSPGRGGIPARPFLMIQDEDADRIEEIFEDYIRGLF